LPCACGGARHIDHSLPCATPSDARHRVWCTGRLDQPLPCVKPRGARQREQSTVRLDQSLSCAT
jgi:hypothetical protein